MSFFKSKSSEQKDIDILRNSPLFNAQWYLERYPDIREAGIDPVQHYIEYGADEGRDPSPDFRTYNYIEEHNQALQNNENPLVHCIRNRIKQKLLNGTNYSLLYTNPLVNPHKDRKFNTEQASKNADLVKKSTLVLEEFCSKLANPDDYCSPGEMPKIFHFVYGFHSTGDIPYYGYMAIKSALHFNPGWTAFLYVMHEPKGPIWDSIKDKINLITIDQFEYFKNAKFYHYAHKADVVRMIALNKTGGIYLDLDTITQRSFADLTNHEFCMGVQAEGPNSASGLCNAVMMGKPKARFSTEWIEHYSYFRSKGRDDLWDYQSVKLPSLLMAMYPDTISVLDYRAFFYPLWNSIEKALFTDYSTQYSNNFAPAYCFHLWNGASGSFLEIIDEKFIRTSKSIYAQIARKVEGISI
jgi:Glycosyltransferase sugar-binding region containing DXD motif